MLSFGSIFLQELQRRQKGDLAPHIRHELLGLRGIEEEYPMERRGRRAVLLDRPPKGEISEDSKSPRHPLYEIVQHLFVRRQLFVRRVQINTRSLFSVCPTGGGST